MEGRAGTSEWEARPPLESVDAVCFPATVRPGSSTHTPQSNSPPRLARMSLRDALKRGGDKVVKMEESKKTRSETGTKIMKRVATCKERIDCETV